MSTTVDPPGGRADLEARVTRLEQDMLEVKGSLGQIASLLIRIDATLTATLPHLATKAELTAAIGTLRTAIDRKPGRGELWAMLTLLIAAYAAGVASLAFVLK